MLIVMSYVCVQWFEVEYDTMMSAWSHVADVDIERNAQLTDAPAALLTAAAAYVRCLLMMFNTLLLCMRSVAQRACCITQRRRRREFVRRTIVRAIDDCQHRLSTRAMVSFVDD